MGWGATPAHLDLRTRGERRGSVGEAERPPRSRQLLRPPVASRKTGAVFRPSSPHPSPPPPSWRHIPPHLSPPLPNSSPPQLSWVVSPPLPRGGQGRGEPLCATAPWGMPYWPLGWQMLAPLRRAAARPLTAGAPTQIHSFRHQAMAIKARTRGRLHEKNRRTERVARPPTDDGKAPQQDPTPVAPRPGGAPPPPPGRRHSSSALGSPASAYLRLAVGGADIFNL